MLKKTTFFNHHSVGIFLKQEESHLCTISWKLFSFVSAGRGHSVVVFLVSLFSLVLDDLLLLVQISNLQRGEQDQREI